MEFHILGPFRLVDADGKTIELSATMERALLLRLLLDANRPVSLPRLIDDLWAGQPPRTALRTLRVYVSRLRTALGEMERITTTAGGYRLSIQPGECDAEQFERLAAAGDLSAALALWTGPALAEVADTEWARVEAARLEERRLLITERRCGADLEAGLHSELVAELEALCAREPLRERLWAILMLALYRSGRPADALAAYTRMRSHLVAELGLEPGNELRVLQQRILAADPELDLNAGGGRPAAHAKPSSAPEAPAPTRGSATNLSPARTSFIPGSLAVATVGDLLSPGTVLTLVGPPGAGKTRLATELARALTHRYPAGVWMVELAAANDGEPLAGRVVDALALESATDSDALALLIDHFGEREGLLVLDNCEHLIAACGELVEALGACPRLAVVCTSRERLGVDAESVIQVPLLEVPPATAIGEETLSAAACRLFVDRAAAAGGRPDLDDPDVIGAIGEVCRRLDGLPLALELAAARTSVLSPVDIAARLDDGLELLRTRRDRLPPRQRTLRALLEWSYSTLEPPEAILLRRLAALPGGASLDAVEQICAAPDLARSACLDALESLAERSLLLADTAHGHARYRLLETVRLYALEKLQEAGEEQLLRGRHADWCIGFAAAAQQRWLAGEQRQASQQLAEEQDSWRAALRWLISAGDGSRATQLAAPLGQWWYANGRTGEGRRMLEAVLALSAPPSRERATVLRFAGALARTVGNIAGARRHIADGIAIADALGDRTALLQLQISLGATTWLGGDAEGAATILAQGLDTARMLGDRRAEGNLSYNLAVLARNGGDFDEALARVTAAGEAWADAGDKRGVALARGLAASVQLRRGDYEESRGLVLEALSMLSGTQFAEAIVEQIETAAALDVAEANFNRAARMLGNAEAIRRAEQLVRPPVDESDVKALLETLGQQLGEQQLGIELAAGAELTLEAGVALALAALAQSGSPVRRSH